MIALNLISVAAFELYIIVCTYFEVLKIWTGKGIGIQARSGQNNYEREVYHMWKERVTILGAI